MLRIWAPASQAQKSEIRVAVLAAGFLISDV
jgi:hypothetical protein